MKDKFEEKFLKFSDFLSLNPYMISYRDGFGKLSVLYLVCAIILMVYGIILKNILSGDTLVKVTTVVSTIINNIISISGVVIAGLCAYIFAEKNNFSDQILCMLASIGIIFVFDENVISLGIDGIIPCALISLVFSGIFIMLSTMKSLKIKLPDVFPPAVADSINSMIPVVIVFVIAGIIRFLLPSSLLVILSDYVQKPILDTYLKLFFFLLLYSFGNFFWYYGIHHSTFNGIFCEPILLIAIGQNMLAYLAGQEIPNIVCSPLINTFMLIGGSGSTTCLLAAIKLFSKDKDKQEVVKTSVMSSLFNINEPVTFGYPVAGNPLMIIPFILVPVTGGIISYYAISSGFMSYCLANTIWTTPPLIFAFLTTLGDIKAVLVQIICFVVGVIIYTIFIKIDEKRSKQKMKNS